MKVSITGLLLLVIFQLPFGVVVAEDSQKIAALVVDLNNNQIVFEQSPDEMLMPASVLKILTSITALKVLGPEYRFGTEFIVGPKDASGEVELFVRGGGDPSFTVESAWQVARELRIKGLSKLRGLVLDDSGFADIHERVGQRAYETGASALAFNHNSVGFDVCPGTLGQSAMVQTLPIEFGSVVGKVRTVSRGANYGVDGSRDVFTASGEIGEGEPCRRFYRSVEDPLGYFGRVFSEILRKEGIQTSGAVRKGTSPAQSAPLFVHHSPALHEILNDLNHFSNNFIANQLVFALDRGGVGPKRFTVGLQALRSELLSLGFDSKSFQIEDGSGLSRENRLNARILVRLLTEAWANPAISAEFQTSLSVMGMSGTLKNRDAPEGAFIRAKTGSLDGVSAISGYMDTISKKKLAFTILINGAASKDKSLEVEAKLLRSFNKR